MKNLFKLFVPVAAAAIALVSCQPKEEQVGNNPAGEITIRVHASADDLKAGDQETKTYIDENKAIIWGTGEFMKLALTAGENTIFATSTDASADIFDGDPEAMFEFSVTPEPASEYVYQGLYPASAAATSNNANAANYKVNLPAIQNATASSYDPAAYIMVAKPETFNAVETDWMASYRRGTALNKITLKNLESGVSIKRVKITAEGKKLAGGRHFNLTTGEGSDVYGTEPTIEVHYATPLSGTNVDVWFTSWDVEIAESEKLTIVAYTTDKKSYTKEITVPAGKTIKFQEGYLNTLGANLSGISSADVTEFEAGDYVVLAKSGSDYFALKAEKESGKERLLSVEYTGNLDAYNGDAELVWTITKSGDSFIFENDSKYLGYKGSSNESYWLEADTNWTEDNYLLDVTPQETTGQYYVTVHSNSARYLSKNSSDPFFAFYGNTGQKADIVFVPATVDTRTPVALSFAEDAINKTTTNYSEFTGQTATATPSVSGITYAIAGDDIGTITAATGAVVLNGNTGSATVTASFAGNTTYRPASASYTIVVSSASGPVYTKVTALSDVTAGTYVIVNDGYYLPNAAATSAGPAKNDNTKVTVSGNNLTGVTNEMTWSFTGSASEMTIKSTTDGDYYLIVSGNGNNNLRINTTSNRTWTISEYSGTSGAFSLKDNTNNRYCASYSSGSDWRSYNSYNAGNYGDGGRIYLYKQETAPDNRQEAGLAWKKGGVEADSDTASLEDDTNILPTIALYNPNNLSVTYSSSEESIATISASGVITLVDDGETTISAEFAGNDSYKPQTVSYTLTVTDNRTPVVSYDFETVAQLNARVTSTSTQYSGYLTNAVVSFVPATNTAIVKDATGSVMIYKSGHGLKQGQTYSGAINVTAVKYNSLYSEITAWDASFTGAEAVVAPESLSLADLIGNYDSHQNAYVQVAGLTVSSVDGKNIHVTDGTNNYVVYDNTSSVSVSAGEVITAIGTITKYQTTEEIKVWKATDVIVTASAPKAITFTQPTGAAATAGCSFTVSVGGSPISSGDTVASGTTVTLTANAGTDYEFTSWAVTGATVADASSASTTFVMGTSAVTISASFTSTGGGGNPTTTTYTFTSKAWADATNSWTSGKDGNQMQSGRGVQVTTGATGANATTKSSLTGVTSVVVTYSTNASNGAGSIAVKIGNNDAHSQNVTKTGGTTDRTLTYTIDPAESGNVTLTVTCTTNSIYVKSVAITHN